MRNRHDHRTRLHCNQPRRFHRPGDGDISWLIEHDNSDEDHGYDAFIDPIDVIVMGRGTWETMRGVRPWHYSRPVVVLSSSLGQDNVPEDIAGKVRILDASPEEAMRLLREEGHDRAYVDGGRLIQSFLRAGLIRDMVITRVPILLGEGRSLFGTLAGDIPLWHEATRSFPSGLVQSRYRIAE